MTEPEKPSLAATSRRRLVWSALVWPTMTMLAFGLAYFLLPWTKLSGIGAFAVAAVGLSIVAGTSVWQIWRIVRSSTPGLQAIHAFATIVPLYLIVCAAALVDMSTSSPDAFSEQLTRMGGLYFTLSTFSTIGFGDIVPVTDAARAAVSVQIVINLIIVGLGIRVVMAAISWARANPR